MAGLLRPGNAGSDTAADHIATAHLALAQLPEVPAGTPTLIRTDYRPPPGPEVRTPLALDRRDHRRLGTARSSPESRLTSTFPSPASSATPTGAVEAGAHPTRQPGHQADGYQAQNAKQSTDSIGRPLRRIEATYTFSSVNGRKPPAEHGTPTLGSA